MPLRIIVLGAAAGGGLPQWNCGCANCAAARAGRIPPLTQSSVAVSADGERWLLLNASPDIRQQIAATPALHPPGLRDVADRAAVLLTNGDVDHVAGLLMLREQTPFTLFATPEIHAVLRDNPIFGVLDPALVAAPRGRARATASGCCRASASACSPCRARRRSTARARRDTARWTGEQTVGVAIRAGRTRAFYVPGCAAMTPALAAPAARRADWCCSTAPSGATTR